MLQRNDELNHEAVTNTGLSASKIATKHMNALPSYLQAKMPKIKSLYQRAHSKQQSVTGKIAATPESLAAIDLPDSFKTLETPDGEVPWLLYDSESEDPSRFLMFGTNKSLLIMKNATTLKADGTFKVRALTNLAFACY